MAITNRERVGKGLALLTKGLVPFVERELQVVHGGAWKEKTAEAVLEESVKGDVGSPTPSRSRVVPRWGPVVARPVISRSAQARALDRFGGT